ncbi:MAG: FliH/SctL family protein [Armatimonadota bacterium]
MSIIKGVGGTPEKPDDMKKSAIKKDIDVKKAEFTKIPVTPEETKQVKEKLDGITKKVHTPEKQATQDAQKIMEQAKVKVAQLYANAKQEAKRIIDSAKLLVHERFEEAQREGRKQGIEEGKAEGRRELAGLADNLKDVFNKLIEERNLIMENAKQEIADLTLACVKEILEEEIKINPEVVLAVATKAVDLAKGSSTKQVTVYVNPEDKKIVEERKEIFAGMVDLEILTVKGDPSMTRGGCRVSTNLGNVDATIETQLKALEIAFEEASKNYDEESE